MNEHDSLLVLFLVSGILLAAIFYFLYRSTLNAAADSEGLKAPLKKRFITMLVMAVFFIAALAVTLPKSPYFSYADQAPSKVIHVGARQFFFIMSNKEIDPENPSGETDIEIPKDQVVEFRVTSFDVTHGFGIYNDKAELVTQTQSMPGYVNILRWKFAEPGKYSILCLEYCGSGHQVMQSSFTVK